MAELYANHFHDLREAEQTILEICDQPRTTTSQLSIALHRLADWHLNLGNNPEAARRALQIICDRLRGSHLAHMAQLRMQRLPRTAEELREQRSAPPIPLPALGDRLDEEPVAELDRAKALDMANVCVKRLKQDPNNISAREKFARILAEHLGKAEQGIEQLTLLLNLPEQPDAKRAEWLGLVAAWHIKYRHDFDTGRKILERVLREFPESPQAFAAQRRIRLLEAENLKKSQSPRPRIRIPRPEV